MIRFAIPIFLGALLVFLVQPILGRIVLPWFGGISSVWITCLLFFQALLLAGYAWAHLAARWGRRGALLHGVLVLVSLLFLPVHPDAALKPAGSGAPTLSILVLLLVTVGLPYVLLAATSPLLQCWFRSVFPERSPYRLYALSNVGSLLALLAYPVGIEPLLTRREQTTLWSVTYAVFALLVVVCAWRAVRRFVPAPTEAGPRPGARRVALWLGLSACGSALLLAVTNQICQEVAVVPFLQVLPLAVYLLTFILCFDHARWYDRRVFAVLLLLVAPAVCYALFKGVRLDVRWQIAIFVTALFAGCMVCHGELVRARPDPRHLTRYYLAIAGGGALGGLFAAVVAPLVFDGYWELHVAFFAACALGLGTWMAAAGAEGRRRLWWRLYFPACVALGGLAVALAVHVRDFRAEVLDASRNFYGVLRVRERSHSRLGRWRSLVHGGTKHGAQFLDPERRRWATSYFAEESGVGLALEHHPRRGERPLRVGVVGLGVGTIAALGQPGDWIRFYEINPEVERLARARFTFLADSEADVEVVLGDARITMEAEIAAGEPACFDVLAIDAFNSDSIPLHLLTAECADVYRALLANDGLLLLHVSNRNLDLRAVARGLAVHLGWEVARITTPRDLRRGVNQASWMVLTSPGNAFLDLVPVAAAIDARGPGDRTVLWTDDFASLWPVLGFP